MNPGPLSNPLRPILALAALLAISVPVFAASGSYARVNGVRIYARSTAEEAPAGPLSYFSTGRFHDRHHFCPDPPRHSTQHL